MRTIDETKVSDESAWLNELPAELDDCIAHRDMEQAVNIFIICYLRVIVADFFSLKIVSVFHFSSVDWTLALYFTWNDFFYKMKFINLTVNKNKRFW